MLNSGRMRRHLLGDVCVERVLSEQPLSAGERDGGETVRGERESEEVGNTLYIPIRGTK